MAKERRNGLMEQFMKEVMKEEKRKETDGLNGPITINMKEKLPIT